jgi:hypothetical protein
MIDFPPLDFAKLAEQYHREATYPLRQNVAEATASRTQLNFNPNYFFGRCLIRVIRVGWTMRRLFPVFPNQQTSATPVGMSQRCHEPTS